jgi:hypothetical protein
MRVLLILAILPTSLLLAGCTNSYRPAERIGEGGFQIGVVDYLGTERVYNGCDTRYVSLNNDPNYADTEGRHYRGTGSTSTTLRTPKYGIENNESWEQLKRSTELEVKVRVYFNQWYYPDYGTPRYCFAPSRDDYGAQSVWRVEFWNGTAYVKPW